MPIDLETFKAAYAKWVEESLPDFQAGKVQEVVGDGVVGEQPHLQPGEGFRYSSGAILETPVGAMQGKYRMVADDGEHFDAPIAPFRLAIPGLLH